MAMNLFKKKAQPVETKANPVGDITIVGYSYRATNFSIENCFKDGYKKNSIVYKCVNMIADAVAPLELSVGMKDSKGQIKDVPNHPVLNLLAKPNPLKSQKAFFRQLFVDYLVAGNMIAARDIPSSGNTAKTEPKELWRINPRFLRVEAGTLGLPLAYIIEATKGKKAFQVNQLDGRCDLFIHQLPNPDDEFIGLSPLVACATWVDVLNNAAEWNASLLENAGSQSGFITMPQGASPDAVARFKSEWDARHAGAKNAGKVALFPMEAKFLSTSISPKDMDFEKAVLTASRSIADTYGIPFPLVSPEAATFNNMESALENFYEQTVIPIARDFLDALGAWLFPYYKNSGEKLVLQFKEDGLPSMDARNKRDSDRAITQREAGLITINEAREVIGRDKMVVPLADELFVGTSQIPISDAAVNTDEVDAALNSMENPDDNSKTKGLSEAN